MKNMSHDIVSDSLLSMIIELEHDCTLVDNVFRKEKGYGACPVFAAKVFDLIGGKIIAGDYEETRHYWIEKDKFIYDMNNIDFEDEVRFLIRNINDDRYDKTRYDSYILNNIHEIRNSVEELGLMSKYEFDTLYNEIKVKL